MKARDPMRTSWRRTMVTLECPWCESTMTVEPDSVDAPEVVCPDCNSAWLMGDPPAAELQLAA
jgi:hypothetical protein